MDIKSTIILADFDWHNSIYKDGLKNERGAKELNPIAFTGKYLLQTEKRTQYLSAMRRCPTPGHVGRWEPLSLCLLTVHSANDPSV